MFLSVKLDVLCVPFMAQHMSSGLLISTHTHPGKSAKAALIWLFQTILRQSAIFPEHPHAQQVSHSLHKNTSLGLKPGDLGSRVFGSLFYLFDKLKISPFWCQNETKLQFSARRSAALSHKLCVRQVSWPWVGDFTLDDEACEPIG
jgi:hypothetical protein